MTFVLNEGARLGAHRATLEVRRSNEAARQLYERLGFVAAGVRRAYYTNPIEDALVLWRERLPRTEPPGSPSRRMSLKHSRSRHPAA